MRGRGRKRNSTQPSRSTGSASPYTVGFNGEAHWSLRLHYADFLANMMGELDRALEQLEVARTVSEGEFEVLTRLAEIQLRQGDLQTAYDTLNVFVDAPTAAVAQERDVLELFVHYCCVNVEALLIAGDAAGATNFMDEICRAVDEWPAEACDIRVQRRMQDAMGLLDGASRARERRLMNGAGHSIG